MWAEAVLVQRWHERNVRNDSDFWELLADVYTRAACEQWSHTWAEAANTKTYYLQARQLCPGPQ